MKKKVTHLKINTQNEDNLISNKTTSVMPDINLNIKSSSPKNNLGSRTGMKSVNHKESKDKMKGTSRSVSRSRKVENMSIGIGMGMGLQNLNMEGEFKDGGGQCSSINQISNNSSSNFNNFNNQNNNNSTSNTNVNNFLRSSGKRRTDPVKYLKRDSLRELDSGTSVNSAPSQGVLSNLSNLSNLPSFSVNNNLKITANTPKYSSMNKPNILSPIHSGVSINSQGMTSEPISARNSNSNYNSFNKTNYNSTKPEFNSNTVNVMSLLSSQHIPLSLSTLKQNFTGYESSKYSNKSIGNIKAYAANTHQGTVRNYNEDRVSIILNIVKPQSYTGEYWPKCSIFGVYDGHGGNSCADYLRDNLHQFVIKDPNFPGNPHEAIVRGFENAEKDYLNNHAIGRNGDVLDRSGSCAIVVFIIDEMCYVANVGDSRAILSKSQGKVLQILTNDHKPNDENEEKRIVEAGGRVYQTQTPTRNFNLSAFNGSYNLNLSPNQILVGPYRVFPGRLSVSRTFGDVEAKLTRLGGMQNVVIATPEITSFKISEDIDFIFIGCDGIYDQLSNKDVLDSIWMTTKEGYRAKNVHSQCSLGIDMIIKSSLLRKTLDNVTCVIIAFENFERFINDRGGNNINTNTNSNNNYSSNTNTNSNTNSNNNIQLNALSNNVSPHVTYKDSPTRLFNNKINNDKYTESSESVDKNSNDFFSLKQCQPLSTKNNRPKNSFALDSTAKEYFLKTDSANSPKDNPSNSVNKKSPTTSFRINSNRKSFNSQIDKSHSNINSNYLSNTNGFLNLNSQNSGINLSPKNNLIISNSPSNSSHSIKHKNRNSYSNNNLNYKEQLDFFNKSKSEEKNEILPLVKSESHSGGTSGLNGLKYKHK